MGWHKLMWEATNFLCQPPLGLSSYYYPLVKLFLVLRQPTNKRTETRPVKVSRCFWWIVRIYA